ncbi:alpha/beta fold hydrolase, partial [Mycoplasmopsis pulmonis]
MNQTKISECKQLRIYVPEPKGNILFLHGFTSRFENHLDIVKHFPDYNVFAINVPGHGDSPFKDPVELAGEYYAHFYKEFIEELKLDSVILMGHSMGGGITTILQGILPKSLVKKIILVNPANREVISTDQKVEHIIKMMPNTIEDTKVVIDSLYYNAKDFFQTEQAYEFAIKSYYDELQKMKHLRIMVDPNRMKRFGQLIQEGIDKIQAPTLLIVGEDDRLVPTQGTVECFKNQKNVKIVYIAKSGHMPMVENPKDYWKEIHTFLE